MTCKSGQSFTGVLVSHPGTQHSYETALAVQGAELLRRYVTGFYYKPQSAWNHALQLLPVRLRVKVETELFRRHQEGLRAEQVKTASLIEILCVAVNRLRLLGRHTGVVLRWRNEWFDRWVGRMAAREKPAALICYNSCALKAFEKARSLGIRCILDQSIAHLRTGLQILRMEAEYHPDFADSLDIEVPDWFLERCSEEATKADYVLAGSEYVRESLIQNGVEPTRVAVIPYGADTERFRPVHRTEDGMFRVLFTGQLSQRKGIKYLLEAVRQLHLPRLELVLVGGVVGTGSGLAAYRDSFTHVRHVPHHQVHTHFHKADVFVYPSLYEGSALAVYEALASGLPVITTPNSGSVVREGTDGFVISIRNVEALKEKILRLYEDKGLRKEMGRNARKRAEQFTWAAYRQRLGSLLREILHMPAQEGGVVAHD